MTLADRHLKERKADRALLHQTYGFVLEAEQKHQEALSEFQQELAIAGKMENGGVLRAVAERDIAGAYQSAGETAEALTHYERAEHKIRELRKHSETPQIHGKMLKQILKKHAALLEQMGRTADAGALRREAGAIYQLNSRVVPKILSQSGSVS